MIRQRSIAACHADAMAAIPLITTPVRQLNERVQELFSKPEPLTEAEWAEWERLTR